MTTYLITGCAGFIGSTFVYYMLKKYQNIRKHSNMSTPQEKRIPAFQQGLTVTVNQIIFTEEAIYV